LTTILRPSWPIGLQFFAWPTEWGFQNIKDLALRYIKHEIPTVVVAYETCAPLAEMLLPLYIELVGRDEFLTDAEYALLGDAKALKNHRTRETLLRAQKKAGVRLDAVQIQLKSRLSWPSRSG
jgi:hypothetical protein